MHVLAGARASGKTTFAIEWAKRFGGVIIEPNQSMADYLVRQGVPKGQVHSADSVRVRGSLKIKRPAAICVENLDILLPYLLGIYQPIELVTATASVQTLGPEHLP